MRRPFLYYLLSFFGTAQLAGFGQALPASVRVVDARTQQSVPYASVGVPGKPLGTVADAQGRFQPAQTGAAATDTLEVSCVGYQPRRLPLAALQQLPELALTPQAQALGEVVVRAATWKRRRVGREAAGGPVLYSFHSRADTLPSARLGREAGAILRVRPGSVMEDAHVFISQYRFQRVRFRLNVRAVDADNHPAASLLTQDVQLALSDSARGWQHIDLRPYNVNVGAAKRVAVTLEWLAGQPRPGKPATWRDWPGVVMPAAFSATHHLVFRHKSEDNWQVHLANLSLYITTVSPD
ncbi:carboxypeptidase-like regulatory domain-containing protein [Hymenobacter sp. RP-2-7]|uniref:Carboxypeptidase-like regulatory domain-containing protein n=1 Tax=Hymenobacter polaris TaxID=2682546 RepID=A0A7Y0FLB1_9BACT|nr:carboxypeptidase-like regulatory domain-containing protein [Hymenobacter polaris]NML64632.1 carboxypeptidase-like regulatory domain-containing protein [Hymenobacter polaris]